ncbi:MAG TPA: hypothetical protein VGH40_16840 [Roseiarcus sp.]|jgi:hypothetical protein
MGFLLRTAFWLGLTFHAMSWGDARLSDVVPSQAQSLAASLSGKSDDGDAAGLIARAVLRGALQPEPAPEAKPRSRVAESASKSKRASVDTLSSADRLPPWRGASLRGTF